ncbi:MAG: HPr family phosphocarrier protein [Christensenellales bacterium]
MKSILIKLDFADSVKEFVSIVEKYPFEIDLRCGRHVVNAKSVLGILSFDLSDAVVLEVYSDECTELINELSRFIV